MMGDTMLRRLGLLATMCLCVCALVLTPGCGDDDDVDQVDDDAPTATVTGTVTCACGKCPNGVVAGATVTLQGKSTTTDANGNYTLTGIVSGTYTITATHPDHASYSHQTFWVVVGGDNLVHSFGMTHTGD